MLNDILKYSEFTCGVILAIFALIQIAYKKRQFINLNIAGLYLCLSYVILSLWSFKSGFIAAIKRINIYIKKGSHKSTKELYALFYYMFFIILFSFMMLLAGVTGSEILNISAIYLLTLAALWYFIFSFRYPEFTQKAIREAKAIRYENSILSGIDSDAVMERLDYLMEEEKIYIDYELTLPKLSSHLMVTPHQLSRILNSKRKINFRTMVNAYRIKESMRQMAEFPDKTILEIAFASGFNSKSSFNSVFLKFTGKTPKDYRTNPGK